MKRVVYLDGVIDRLYLAGNDVQRSSLLLDRGLAQAEGYIGELQAARVACRVVASSRE